ncbi:MAG: FAD-dependent oxidoreductase [Candidatus Hydrogenedentota bacterium]
MRNYLCVLLGLLFILPTVFAQQVLVEAESFESWGGWKLDTQSIEVMGSPYMIAHGLGTPVADATTTVTFPEPGTYRVFARTKDWVARWDAKGQPGRFQILVDGKAVSETFGTKGKDWFWHDGGTVNISDSKATISLRDLTGFAGRCDAIYFVKDGEEPPNESGILSEWRLDLLGLSENPIEQGNYDFVVIGGGYAGMGAAISASRMGLRVALIQNRGVLGGNGSSEIRVWANGEVRRGKYPRLGEIVEEFTDHASKSPGSYEEFEDDKKEAIVRAEQNIDLFLNHHAYEVETENNRIVAVYAFDTRTSERRRFAGKLFSDCTGHGTIGFLAGADWDMTPDQRMGMSNMWAWDEAESPREFPETPWALQLEMGQFPYPQNHHGQWFWESGFDMDPIGDAEGIRDGNFRAVYGAFSAMKHGRDAEKHKAAYLTWMAYIGGTRESRRLIGDVLLTRDDIVGKKDFSDGCVATTWSIDLHYPKKQYAQYAPDNPFIAVAVQDELLDRQFGYPVPYRTFYSRNIDNLFMAGRNISVTHEALGTTRVMRTCGMMGEVVGRAASIAVLESCTPREVYTKYWSSLDALMRLPGKARRATLDDVIVIPDDAMKLASTHGVISGFDPAEMDGIVVDDRDAVRTGKWSPGSSLKGYFAFGYLYASANSGATIRFNVEVPESGRYEVRIAYQPHDNRGSTVPIRIVVDGVSQEFRVDMRKKAPMKYGLYPLTSLELTKGHEVSIVLGTKDAGGIVHADAVSLARVN